ncbi:PIG-L family deacetylase [Jannaschia sp. S6380]|uniref:PIG-L deacetylase family protein n=1 Tax=Jannaschia sp. S6380 TaxID=2926408 RepID=UPI001FF2E8A9|nr:PIG-L family deacetylase [Jannaschia sp. S6380]MCK0168502.1 PIG-L family deacetylase [Jannaschia sp. S6380]
MERTWRRLEGQAMRTLWRFIAARSVDRTEMLSSGSCLILAPHPDDETLGCGGLAMLKRRAGARVDVVVATDGGATGAADGPAASTDVTRLRERETIAACALLDIDADRITFLGLPDGELARHEGALRRRLSDIVAELRPDQIYVCAAADGHRDHKALARATQALVDDGMVAAGAVREYPVWFWDFRSWRPEGQSNKRGFLTGLRAAWVAARRLRVVHVSLAGLVDRKRAALECHGSQLGPTHDTPEWDGLPQHFVDFFLRDRELFFEAHPPSGESGASR